MNHTLEKTLKDVVAPYLPPQLICPTHFTNIGKVARILPSAVTSFFGFQCRLGESAPVADFLARWKTKGMNYENSHDWTRFYFR